MSIPNIERVYVNANPETREVIDALLAEIYRLNQLLEQFTKEPS